MESTSDNDPMGEIWVKGRAEASESSARACDVSSLKNMSQYPNSGWKA